MAVVERMTEQRPPSADAGRDGAAPPARAPTGAPAGAQTGAQPPASAGAQAGAPAGAQARAPAAGRLPAIGRSLAGPLRPAISLGFVLAIWAGVSASGSVNEALFPAPWTVVEAFAEMAAQGVLLRDLGVSLGRAAVGFAIGASLGVAIGLATGRTRLFQVLLGPFLTLMRPIPAIALVPVAIVWFGIGEASKHFVIAYTVFLTVWFNTHHGMQYVPEIYIRASRSLGASRLREFAQVVVPAAAPHIVAGLRLGVALALLSLVAAELTGASSGIGYRLQEARQYVRTDRMFALLIVLGVAGAAVDQIVHRISRRLVHWEQAG